MILMTAWQDDFRCLVSEPRMMTPQCKTPNAKRKTTPESQGNRVLTEQDFEEVVVLPACLQALCPGPHFQAGFPVSTGCGLSASASPCSGGCGLCASGSGLRGRRSEFSMLQWVRTACSNCSRPRILQLLMMTPAVQLRPCPVQYRPHPAFPTSEMLWEAASRVSPSKPSASKGVGGKVRVLARPRR